MGDGSVVTEAWVARQFANEYGNRLAFCHSRGCWYEFDGSIWRAQEKPVAFHYTRQLAERMSANAKNRSSMQKSSFCKGVEAFARADPIFASTATDWDKDLFLLGTPYGTVDLKTGEFRKAKPNDRITKSVAISPDEIEDCSTWERFLMEATNNDAGLVRFLKQICGYALTGDISEQSLFFIFGDGGNGKGVFLSVLQNIMADYSQVAPMEALEKQKFSAHTTDLAMMMGARLVSASETVEGGAWNETRIKNLTGGDKITARFMHKNNITFVPQLTLLVIGNSQPALRTVDEAMRRRFNMIPFVVKPVRKDKHLAAKLQLEWPGILRWMINGCLDWQENGFVRPESVIVETARYFTEQDTFGEWMETCCDRDMGNIHLTQRSSTMFESWAKFARSSGMEPGDAKTFKGAMRRAGHKDRRFADGVHYLNIKLKGEHFERDDGDPFAGR